MTDKSRLVTCDVCGEKFDPDYEGKALFHGQYLCEYCAEQDRDLTYEAYRK